MEGEPYWLLKKQKLQHRDTWKASTASPGSWQENSSRETRQSRTKQGQPLNTVEEQLSRRTEHRKFRRKKTSWQLVQRTRHQAAWEGRHKRLQTLQLKYASVSRWKSFQQNSSSEDEGRNWLQTLWSPAMFQTGQVVMYWPHYASLLVRMKAEIGSKLCDHQPCFKQDRSSCTDHTTHHYLSVLEVELLTLRIHLKGKPSGNCLATLVSPRSLLEQLPWNILHSCA